MVGVLRQFGVQPLRADRGRILITSKMRDERRIGNVQRKLAILSGLPHLKPVFTHEGIGFETHVLNEDSIAHLAPGTNTREARTGGGVATLTRLVRRRLGATPSAGSTTIKLVTNSLIP